METRPWLKEIVKWLYVTVVGVVLALFFTLLLDGFCFVAFGGWQPLLGPWPIFSGTIGVVYFGNPWLVLALVAGLGAVGRIMLGEQEPALLSGWSDESVPVGDRVVISQEEE